MNSPQEMESIDNFKEIFSRIGLLTRHLRDSVANLGLDRAIMNVAEAIPDTRERLNYVVGKTSQAANLALNAVEVARPLQNELQERSTALSQRWDLWFETPETLPTARKLVEDTRQFLSDTPSLTKQTNDQLMDIMMAQDFQDLTGQVIQNLMSVIETVENELLQVLIENMPEALPGSQNEQEGLKNGPQIDHTRTGVVATQEQVDDLLDTLGF